MSWSVPDDLRAQVQRMWDNGELLVELIIDTSCFPKRLKLKTPTSTEMSDRFDEVCTWINRLRALPYYRIEMREFKHRILGSNAIPDAIWIDTIEDALALIGKQCDAHRFRALSELTRQRQPLLFSWLLQRPLRALALADVWGKLLDIVDWLRDHPRPGIYLRQVDIPGIHSKFIEAHRGVLIELLDMVLPSNAIVERASGINQFAQRYGFCDKPLHIRCRILDPDHTFLATQRSAQISTQISNEHIPDITLDVDSFAQLAPNVSRIFITENEINFLTFPPQKDSLVIFGRGYGFEMLRGISWLAHKQIHYWGDIDTHGFAILDQLRAQFTHVESFLMDRKTLMAFASLWGDEDKQTLRDLPNLRAEEKTLYDDLRDNRIRKNLRLEQEFIGFTWVQAALAAMKVG